MKISCNVIRDLLPLYAEDLASEDTRTLVKTHLCDCADCANVLKDMQKTTPVLADTAVDSLGRVKRLIRRRRLISVMAAVMTLLTVASAVVTYLFTPFQLTKEQALDDFYIRQDGAVVIDYSPLVSGRLLSGNGDNWYINQYSTRYDIWKGENRKSVEEMYGSDGVITEEEQLRYDGIDIHYGRWETPDGRIASDYDIPCREDDRVVEWASEKNWWYADPYGLGNDVLLHDAGKSHPEHRAVLNPVYPAVFFGGFAAAVILLFVGKIIRKPMIKEVFMRLSVLAGSAAAATLLVSSGRIVTSAVGIISQYWNWLIPVNTALLTLTVLLFRQLYLMNRQDSTI